MQLGANKVPTGVASAALASKLADEVAASEGINDGNPWGTDDLIDINADQDDWSESVFCLLHRKLTFLYSGAFESAPTPAFAVVEPKPVSAVAGLGIGGVTMQNSGRVGSPSQGV